MITLLPFINTDFEKLISWVNTEEIMAQFAGTYFTFPLTREQLERYLADTNRIVYKVVLTETNAAIGHAEIYFEKSTAMLCRILIGDTAYRGLGIGHQIVDTLLEISFTKFATEKVELNVFDWNIGAVKCYRKAGFTINAEKTKKREVKGKKWIVLNMSIAKSEWENNLK